MMERSKITAAIVRDLLHYSPETGEFRWRAPREGPREHYEGAAGGARGTPETIDHINGDGDDNRFANLRLATYRQNSCNQGASSRNKSGFRGVSPTRNGQRFSAFMGVEGQSVYLGTFDTPEQAARAYDTAAAAAHGLFARLNFPEQRIPQ